MQKIDASRITGPSFIKDVKGLRIDSQTPNPDVFGTLPSGPASATQQVSLIPHSFQTEARQPFLLACTLAWESFCREASGKYRAITLTACFNATTEKLDVICYPPAPDCCSIGSRRNPRSEPPHPLSPTGATVLGSLSLSRANNSKSCGGKCRTRAFQRSPCPKTPLVSHHLFRSSPPSRLPSPAHRRSWRAKLVSLPLLRRDPRAFLFFKSLVEHHETAVTCHFSRRMIKMPKSGLRLSHAS